MSREYHTSTDPETCSLPGHSFGCQGKAGGEHSLAPLRYHVIEECPICHRRPGDIPVMIEGRVEHLCETCWMRAEDEIERDDEPPDLNREGDPAFNGAFNAW